MLSAAAVKVDVSQCVWFCMCAGQGEWYSQIKGPQMPYTHTHTHHPDLTRLVNHLSQGQGNGQTPLSSVCPPSLPLYLSLYLLLYSFIVSLSKDNCPFPPILTLYISAHGFISFSFCLLPLLLQCLPLFPTSPPRSPFHPLYNPMSWGLFPSLVGTKLSLYHSAL